MEYTEETMHFLFVVAHVLFYVLCTVAVVFTSPGSTLSSARDAVLLEARRHSFFHRIFPVLMFYAICAGFFWRYELILLAVASIMAGVNYVVGLCALRCVKLHSELQPI